MREQSLVGISLSKKQFKTESYIESRFDSLQRQLQDLDVKLDTKQPRLEEEELVSLHQMRFEPPKDETYP